MSVVHLSAYRPRGGLKRDQVWVERAFPEHRWIISEVLVDDYGQRRVVIEPLEDRTRESSYSETYFRRHFIDRHAWLRRENERALRMARKQDAKELLHEMARMHGR